MTYRLVRIADGKEVEIGKTQVTFNSSDYVVTSATPPQKAGSAGKVIVTAGDFQRELYATAVGLQWLWIEEDRDSQFNSKFN